MSDDTNYRYRPFIYRAKNGTEILISVYIGDRNDQDGTPELLVTMATRADKYETWGPPLQFERAP